MQKMPPNMFNSGFLISIETIKNCNALLTLFSLAQFAKIPQSQNVLLKGFKIRKQTQQPPPPFFTGTQIRDPSYFLETSGIINYHIKIETIMYFVKSS